MKKKKLTLLVAFLIAVFPLAAQTHFEWVIGDSAITEKGVFVHQTPHGTIFLVGQAANGSIGDAQVTLQKFTPNGQLIWTKSYFDTSSEYPLKGLLANGTFYIVGERHETNGDINGFILQLDTLGNVLQHKIIGTNLRNESLQNLSLTTDGGVLVVGFVTANSGNGNDFYIVKLDANFNVVWRKNTGGNTNETASGGVEMPNGNYLIAGDQQQSGGNYNVYLQCFHQSGTMLWDKTVTSVFNGGAKDMILTSRGDALIVGEMTTSNSNAFDIYLVCVEQNGTIKWTNYATNHPFGDAGFNLIEPTPNAFVIAGYGANPISQNQDLVMVSVDSTGNAVAAQYYGDSLSEVGYCVTPSVSGDFLLTGFTSRTNGDPQYFVIHDDINLAVRTSPAPLENDLTILPNPVQQRTLHFSRPLPNPTKLTIFDAQGRFVESASLSSTSENYTLQNFIFPNQFYWVRLEMGQFSKTFQLFFQE